MEVVEVVVVGVLVGVGPVLVGVVEEVGEVA